MILKNINKEILINKNDSEIKDMLYENILNQNKIIENINNLKDNFVNKSEIIECFEAQNKAENKIGFINIIRDNLKNKINTDYLSEVLTNYSTTDDFNKLSNKKLDIEDFNALLNKSFLMKKFEILNKKVNDLEKKYESNSKLLNKTYISTDYNKVKLEENKKKIDSISQEKLNKNIEDNLKIIEKKFKQSKENTDYIFIEDINKLKSNITKMNTEIKALNNKVNLEDKVENIEELINTNEYIVKNNNKKIWEFSEKLNKIEIRNNEVENIIKGKLDNSSNLSFKIKEEMINNSKELIEELQNTFQENTIKPLKFNLEELNNNFKNKFYEINEIIDNKNNENLDLINDKFYDLKENLQILSENFINSKFIKKIKDDMFDYIDTKSTFCKEETTNDIKNYINEKINTINDNNKITRNLNSKIEEDFNIKLRNLETSISNGHLRLIKILSNKTLNPNNWNPLDTEDKNLDDGLPENLNETINKLEENLKNNDFRILKQEKQENKNIEFEEYFSKFNNKFNEFEKLIDNKIDKVYFKESIFKLNENIGLNNVKFSVLYFFRIIKNIDKNSFLIKWDKDISCNEIQFEKNKFIVKKQGVYEVKGGVFGFGKPQFKFKINNKTMIQSINDDNNVNKNENNKFLKYDDNSNTFVEYFLLKENAELFFKVDQNMSYYGFINIIKL